MNRPTSSRRILAACTTAMLCLAQGVRADDTEIFTASPPADVNTKPNILFILDTSGSMETIVTTQEPYDPANTYTGACTAGRIYWLTDDDSLPNCGDKNDKNQWISDANFLCASARTQLDTTGFKTQAAIAQWDGSSKDATKHAWLKSLTSSKDSQVDCKQDSTLTPPHGDGTANGAYATTGKAGPYNSVAANQIIWSGYTKNYSFYTANYINWKTNVKPIKKSRMQIMKEVAKTTLDGLSDVNVGLMRYSTDGEGGMVVSAMAPVETARQSMKDAIDAFNPSGNTPLSETMYEAYLYYTGGKADYGVRKNVAPKKSAVASLLGDGVTYRSPLGQACQKNFIIYLTDGEPNGDKGADNSIQKVIGKSCTENGVTHTENGVKTVGDGRCLDDMARYMYATDLFIDPNVPKGNVQPKENIRTYTIGFGDGVSQGAINLLTATASGDPNAPSPPGDEGGGGKFYFASDTASLTEVFQNIIQFILDDAVSFTSPTVSVNAFNRTQNLNDLFITVFSPQEVLHWPGNLKKYRLNQNGEIRDVNDVAAVDPDTGFFKSSSRSFWSDSQDGVDVDAGGAAHEQKPLAADRNVFTDVAALAGGSKELKDTANAVQSTNAAITIAMLGLPTTATVDERADLIEWTRGADAYNSDATAAKKARLTMGDPLHARPVSVIYGGTADAPDAVVYTATNDGYLHAIDPSDGSELWTYIPSELLPRMAALEANEDSKVKGYGLDGSLRAFKLDKNNNGIVDSGDKVYLYFGMGAGGTNYYALDITSKDSPKLLWRNGADKDLTGLGETWSAPVVTRVNVSDKTQNTEKLVVMFAGGYDPTQDNIPYNSDDRGNRLFMLDAVSGELLWEAGPASGSPGFDAVAPKSNFTSASLVNSIPSDLRVLDLTNDGFADRMYVGDTGGQVWRFDITNGNTADKLVAGGVFASLGALAKDADKTVDNRRFYNAPDIALLKADGQSFLNIAIGSGYRGHPLNKEMHDRFYSLRDYLPFTPMLQTQYNSLVAITEKTSSLINVTTNVTPTIPPGAAGWRLELSSPTSPTWTGEKVLAEARTFQGAILFPTFTPSSKAFTECTAQAGSNALFAVAALDGSPFTSRDGNTTPDAADRRTPLNQRGIASETVILFPSPDDPKTCVGKQCSPPPVCIVGVESCRVSFGNDPVKTFWMQKDTD